jgi:signal transduction histidine kinase
MAATPPRRSLRTQLILVMLVAALVPLALLALWLARATGQAGETLLTARLDAAVLSAANETGVRWVEYRSALLDLGEALEVRRALGDTVGAIAGPALMPAGVRLAVVRDTVGAVRWARAADTTTATGAFFRPVLTLWSRRAAGAIGSLEATLPGSAIVRATGATGGTTLAAFDRRTGLPLLATPFDPDLASKATFNWNGERWLVARRTLDEPAIEIVAAAPVADYQAPFADAARRGLIALLVVAMLSTVATVALTRRLTRSLGDLALAADGVSRGEMGRTVPVPESEELGRLAEAFNTMSESLRRTLDSLARRESLSAVGEFAASLSHEVRNPLTAMRIDLQRVEEKLDLGVAAPPAAAPRAARGGPAAAHGEWRAPHRAQRQVARTPVDLLVPLDAALHASEPEMQAAGARVEVDTGDVPLVVLGDAAALEQLFLNLLLNAAQAFDAPGGVVRVRAACRRNARAHRSGGHRTRHVIGNARHCLRAVRPPRALRARASASRSRAALPPRTAASSHSRVRPNRHDGGRHHTAFDLKRSPQRIASLRAAAARDASLERQVHSSQRDTRRGPGGAVVACGVAITIDSTPGLHPCSPRHAVPSPIATSPPARSRGAGRA